MLGFRASGKGRGRALRRGLADFILALSLFWVVALGASSDMRAHAVPLPSVSNHHVRSDGAVPSLASMRAAESDGVTYGLARSSLGRRLDLVLLSLTFAALLAGNLAFWRHLRRAYASPRRSVWRRG
jgi:hypothetical protein